MAAALFAGPGTGEVAAPQDEFAETAADVTLFAGHGNGRHRKMSGRQLGGMNRAIK